MRPANVPVFIPHLGCPHQCSFCNQRTISGAIQAPEPVEAFAIAKAALEKLGGRQAQIAFFGGSFTALDREYMISLLRAVQPLLREGGYTGIRVSTRPDAIDKSVLRLLAENGVTAIELGAQSMNVKVLEQNLRGHTPADTVKAAGLIREMGFELGLQMMTGLPGDSPVGALESGKKMAALKPDTMRIYPVLVLENTPLASLWREGTYSPQELEEAVELCARLLELYERNNIRVIRLGLHDEESMRESVLAGPWHPAFRELCEGRLMLERARAQLEGFPAGKVRLVVNPKWISRMAGQRKSNLRELEQSGYCCGITGSPGVLPGKVLVLPIS